MKNFDNLIDQVENDKDITENQWEIYDEKFRAMVEECYDQYETEMTRKEKRQFWLKSLKYYRLRIGKGIIDGMFNRGKKELEELKKEAEEALEELE